MSKTRDDNERFTFFKSIVSIKENQAKSNVTNLQNWGLLKDKGLLVLDIGSGIGFNAKAMQKAGANVIAVEPDKTACDFAIENGILSKENLHNCSAQELPKELNGKFDLITIFLFSIPRQDCDAVFKRASELLKPDGKLAIGTEIEGYTAMTYSDKTKISLRPTLEKYFDSIDLYTSPDSVNTNKYVLVCKSLKKLELKASPILNI